MSRKLRTILFTAWIAGAVIAAAQSTPQTGQSNPPQAPPAQPPPVQAPPEQPPQQTPPPSTTTPPEPVATAPADQSANQEYQGPTIVSRDSSIIGERGGKLLDFRVWAGITGVYDTGIVPVSTDQTGHLTNVPGSDGIEANFGASGTRKWKGDTFSLDYSGSFRHYFDNSSLDGIDQFLALRWAHVLSRHVTLDIKETAGTSNLANGAFTYLPLTAIDLAATPTNELFDNRIYYSQSKVGLTWQKTARLSFSVSGQGYIVRRASAALAGLNGYTGGGDVAYRITRRQTIDVSYAYTNYDYQRTFGSANVQTVAAGYSIGFGRRWDASISLGGSRAEARGEQQIAVSPAIVAIIGVPTIVTTFDTFKTVPYGAASIVRRFSRSAVTVNATTGVSPGNGVYLTSRGTTASVAYSYVGLRRWTMGANFVFSEFSSIGQAGLGTYDNYQGGLAATYRIGPDMHMEFRYDYRHFSANNSFFLKDSQRISVGFAWSPGNVPLAIW